MNTKLNLLQKYFLYFLMYSILGWIYEVFLEVVVYRWGYSDRGVLFGPYCPVYGVGALLFLFLIYPLIKDRDMKQKLLFIPAVFLLCAVTATAVELLASYICELFTGSWPWQTYADYSFNFQARIALSPSVRFGIGGVVILYVLQPLLEKLTDKLNDRKLTLISSVTAALFTLDLAVFIINHIK